MGLLIDDMLQLARVTRAEMRRISVDLTAIAHSVATRIEAAHAGRQIEFVIQPGAMVAGDPQLLEVVLTNLLENASKFTSKQQHSLIEFGFKEEPAPIGAARTLVYFVRDNGAGFDMTYAQKLFGAFQRMHKTSEFPGSGVGLAIVQRIIHRHGGRVWADAQMDQGATFFFTLAAPTPLLTDTDSPPTKS